MFFNWLAWAMRWVLRILGIKRTFRAAKALIVLDGGPMGTKKCQSVLEDFDGLATIVPGEYRIEFAGPGRVEPIVFPYGTEEDQMNAARVFDVDGDYVASFALYDRNAEVIGHLVQITFTIVAVPTTKTFRVASDLIVTTVPPVATQIGRASCRERGMGEGAAGG